MNLRKTILAASLLLIIIASPTISLAVDTKYSLKKGAGIGISPINDCGTQNLNDPCLVRVLEKVRSLGVTWLYNWGVGRYVWIDKNIEYVPMVRVAGKGPNGNYTEEELSGFKAYAQSRPGSYWLIWNEPDYYKQANISPNIAAAIYQPLRDALKSADPNAKLIIGGLAWMDTTWVNSFREEYKKIHSVYPPLEGWAFHHYMSSDYTSNLWRSRMNGIRNWMNDKGYSNKEFWLTEYGSLDSNAIGLQIMKDQQEWLEAPEQSWVTRYAWFFLAVENDTFQGNLLTGNIANMTVDLSQLGLEYAIHPAGSTYTPAPSPPYPQGLNSSWNQLYPSGSITTSTLSSCYSGTQRIKNFWRPWTKYQSSSTSLKANKISPVKCKY